MKDGKWLANIENERLLNRLEKKIKKGISTHNTHNDATVCCVAEMLDVGDLVRTINCTSAKVVALC